MKDLSSEFEFAAVRSSGPGGQNVNKTASKVEIRFNVDNSLLLTEVEKQKIKEKLANHITNDSEIIITAQTDRSQLKNKETAIKKFYRLLEKAFVTPKPRKATQPSAASKEVRREKKRRQADKKAQRQKREWE